MQLTDTKSPNIEHISWGNMVIEGPRKGKDFKLWPGGAREWDWAETNTHHVPGIQPSDVEELIEHGSRIIILSRGMLLQLQTCPETLAMLNQRGVTVHVQETKKAAETYNRLAGQGERVGGLFHSTC